MACGAAAASACCRAPLARVLRIFIGFSSYHHMKLAENDVDSATSLSYICCVTRVLWSIVESDRRLLLHQACYSWRTIVLLGLGMARVWVVVLLAALLIASAVAHNDGSCWTGTDCDNDATSLVNVCGTTYCLKNFQVRAQPPAGVGCCCQHADTWCDVRVLGHRTAQPRSAMSPAMSPAIATASV